LRCGEWCLNNHFEARRRSVTDPYPKQERRIIQLKRLANLLNADTTNVKDVFFKTRPIVIDKEGRDGLVMGSTQQLNGQLRLLLRGKCCCKMWTTPLVI
jgi:hypothetical protein